MYEKQNDAKSFTLSIYRMGSLSIYACTLSVDWSIHEPSEQRVFWKKN